MKLKTLPKYFHFAVLLLGSACQSTVRVRGEMQAAPPPIFSGEGATRISLDEAGLKEGRLVVWVRINGKQPLPFLVDTGVPTPVVIDRWAAERLGVDANSPTTIRIANSGIRLRGADLQECTILSGTVSADLQIESPKAYVGDLQLSRFCDSVRLAGVIGMPILEEFTTQIDVADKCLRVSTQPHPALTIPGSVSLPLTPDPNSNDRFRVTLPVGWPFNGTSFNDMRPTPETLSLLLDTGSDRTYLPWSTVINLPNKAMFLSPVLTTGAASNTTVALTALQIGYIKEEDVAIGVATPEVEPTLGIDLLVRFRVTLDGPHKQLFLEPLAVSDEIPAPGFTGIQGMIIKKGERQETPPRFRCYGRITSLSRRGEARMSHRQHQRGSR